MNPKLPRSKCLTCGKENRVPEATYCSNKCQHKWRRQEYIMRWELGQESGYDATGRISGIIRNYLLEKYDFKCAKCGWGEMNPTSGKIPLTVEHIDGDFRNCSEENLIILCPNCHSLTPTYCALNKGNGRRRLLWDKFIDRKVQEKLDELNAPITQRN